MANNTKATAEVDIRANTKQAEANINKLEGSIKVLDGAVNLVGGTLETVAGGLALTGALSKEQAERFEGLAVGAIAFADGAKRTLDGVVNLQEGLTKLGKDSQLAAKLASGLGKGITKLLGPIGLVIAAFGVISTAVAFLAAKFESVNKVVSFFGNLLNKVTDAIGLTNTELDKQKAALTELGDKQAFQLELLKAEGASKEELIQKERELLKTRIKAAKDGSEEQKKAAQDLALFNAKVRGENAKADEDAAKKRLEDAKTANQLYKDQLQKFADEEANLKAKTEEDKLKLDFDRTIREINELKLSEARKAQLRLEAEENYQIKVGQLKEDKIKEQAEKEAALQLQLDQAQRDRENENIVNYSAQLDEIYNLQLSDQQRSLNAVEDKYFQLEQYYKDDAEALKAITEQKERDITAIEEAGNAARRKLIGDTIDNFQGALTALFGESKAVASANVLIDAAQAAVGIIKNSQSTGPLAIAYQVSQFALLAATTIASLRDINSAEPGTSKTPSTPKPSRIGGGAFTGALPGTGGTPNSGIPTTGTSGGRTEPIRAYVISQDVTNGQEASAAINRRRRLGGG